MKKKNLFSGDSKYDFLRGITNDDASNVRGGAADTPVNLTNPPSNPPNIPNTPGIISPPTPPPPTPPIQVNITNISPTTGTIKYVGNIG